ncbi:hypothetical protein E1212_26795 [Jiangella ureilytica]|uniref:Uncharacterized protein n=1 Tax=Jiangella ureilytica TaxID=2530374 RepID=A0A4R4RBJ5_9ACTN|nr:hypothetical protein [Jiangella ureilytica]TDC46476.1 hypothetical protein E1212_26795 [Jiangella ureilytica]
MSAARSGPFTWSSFGVGYLVASVDDGGSPVVDVVLPRPADGALHTAAALPPADAARLGVELTTLTSVTDDGPLRLLPDLRDRVAALDAALLDLSSPDAGDDDGSGVGGALDAVDDLIERLYGLRGELTGAAYAGPSAAARMAAGRSGGAETVMTGPDRAAAPDRRLTTMGGLALALGIVAIFWIALGVLLWTVLR